MPYLAGCNQTIPPSFRLLREIPTSLRRNFMLHSCDFYSPLSTPQQTDSCMGGWVQELRHRGGVPVCKFPLLRGSLCSFSCLPPSFSDSTPLDWKPSASRNVCSLPLSPKTSPVSFLIASALPCGKHQIYTKFHTTLLMYTPFRKSPAPWHRLLNIHTQVEG